MAAHNDLGKWGERIAAEHLISEGWYIRHCDWTVRGVDLDIVCIDEDSSILVFVEVKTRTSDDYGRPSLAVDEVKRRNIIKASEAYRRLFRLTNLPVRYDIISIVGTPKTGFSLEHMEDAFGIIDIIE